MRVHRVVPTLDSSGGCSRRDFGRAAWCLALSGVVPARSSAVDPVQAGYAAARIDAVAAELPMGKRLSFGWKAVAVTDAQGDPVTLRFPDVPDGRTPVTLRVCVALETRDERLVEVVSLTSRKLIGSFDVRYACLFQPYSVPLGPEAAKIVADEGIGLRLAKGAGPVWVFTDGKDLPDAFRPHLLLRGTADPYSEFFLRLGSLASVQPFGWMEGCVLDGLLDLAMVPEHKHFLDTVKRHLALFLPGGKLVYENPVSVPGDGRVYGIEGTLPFAALARLEPDHKLLDVPLKFWAARADADGCVIDGTDTTSEGSYTVGYPMAVIGRARKSDDLERAALTQIRVRQARLFDGKTFWRTRTAGGRKGDRNWVRGVAWQLLGTARTLGVLKDRDDLKDAKADFQKLAEWAIGLQRPDGLWSVFMDEPKLAADTAGTAGLAAALALGVKFGWLGDAASHAAEQALKRLKTHLTPDGFLGGVSQANKGGQTLQRGDYRVVYQMGMGLMGQLIAARLT